MRNKLNYDDVLIIPQYSTIETRKGIDLITKATKRVKIKIPIITAPMDTVTEGTMASTIGALGGLGVIHRYCTIEEQQDHVITGLLGGGPVAAAIGVRGDWQQRAENLAAVGALVLVIDVAHADHKFVHNALMHLKTDSGFRTIDIMVGNIATASAAERLAELGADGLRVGVGPGAHCTTRVETGVGYPQLSAIIDITETLDKRSLKVPICADGGIRFAGDVVKALAAGASTIMAGSLFAATKESPGDIMMVGYGAARQKVKEYRGMASYNAKIQDNRNGEHIEGISKFLPYRGPVEEIIRNLQDGIRSGLSYVGANNLTELRSLAQFVQVSATDNHLPKMSM